MKQAAKGVKSIKKNTGLSLWKEKNGIVTSSEDLSLSNASKPIEWLIMPKAFQEATRLPGFPCGNLSIIGGFSDTGKSTILNHVIVAAQRQGYIVVIYDTENNLDWSYLINMGFDARPVYGEVELEKFNPQTGETYTEKTNSIIEYTNDNDDFMYFNQTILLAKYGQWDYSTGKETKTRRTTAVIEDVAASMRDILRAQEEGIINQGVVFVWDSIGSISSYKSYKSPTNNNMFDASSLSVAFSDILNYQIPKSKKISYPYMNTFVVINKIWLDSMSSPMSMPTVKYKGGNTFYYACHGIICHVGGSLTSGTKKLKATSKGMMYKYGMESKIKIVKSHLPSPYDITYEGSVICTSHGLIAREELAQYQKEHMPEMLSHLNSDLAKLNDSTTSEDVSFIEEEEEE